MMRVSLLVCQVDSLQTANGRTKPDSDFRRMHRYYIILEITLLPVGVLHQRERERQVQKTCGFFVLSSWFMVRSKDLKTTNHDTLTAN
jgi:hypothetical protein